MARAPRGLPRAVLARRRVHFLHIRCKHQDQNNQGRLQDSRQTGGKFQGTTKMKKTYI